MADVGVGTSTATFDVIDLEGSAHQLGVQHGRAAADRIAACLDVYWSAFRRGDDELRAAARRVEAVVRPFAPDTAAEIDGVAEGSGIEPWRVWTLNARSELMAGATDGCTAVFTPERGLLGQTWDWRQEIEALVVVLRARRDDGRSWLTLTEPGIVAKIGLNDAGLGVCLNFLWEPGTHRGVPVHVLLHALLSGGGHDAAAAIVEAAGVGRAANVLVGSGPDKRGFDVEYLGERRWITEAVGAPLVHTNHVEGIPGSAGDDWYHRDSCTRAARARELAGTVEDLDDLVALLDDRGHDDHPICVPYKEWDGVVEGTAATVAMDLDRRTMWVRRGPHPGSPTQTVELTG